MRTQHRRPPTRRAALAATAVLAVMTAVRKVGAQANWPDRPVRIVVPSAPGGTTDFAARQIAQPLGELLGQSFYVENRPGGSATIGTQLVAKAPPDGSVLLCIDTAYSMLPAAFSRLPWDHGQDLVGITTILETPVVLVVPATSPHRSLSDLLTAAKRAPGKLNFGSGGAGSSAHLQAEVLGQAAGVAFTHVPYKGAGEAMLGVVSGQVDMLITASPTAIAQVRGGRVRALAATGTRRVDALPDVPTFVEAGVPSFSIANWFGLAAPRGTSPQIVQKLHQTVVRALADPAMQERLASQGARPGGQAPLEFNERIRQETVKWTQVARTAGLVPQ